MATVSESGKKVKNLQNGPTLANRSSAVYDHVFRLKVDSEPAGPDLDARRFSWTCDVVALSKIFQNVQIYDVKKTVFRHFPANRSTDFQTDFFLFQVFPRASKKVLTTMLLGLTVWPLFHFPFFSDLISSPPDVKSKISLNKWEVFFKKTSLSSLLEFAF